MTPMEQLVQLARSRATGVSAAFSRRDGELDREVANFEAAIAALADPVALRQRHAALVDELARLAGAVDRATAEGNALAARLTELVTAREGEGVALRSRGLDAGCRLGEGDEGALRVWVEWLSARSAARGVPFDPLCRTNEADLSTALELVLPVLDAWTQLSERPPEPEDAATLDERIRVVAERLDARVRETGGAYGRCVSDLPDPMEPALAGALPDVLPVLAVLEARFARWAVEAGLEPFLLESLS